MTNMTLFFNFVSHSNVQIFYRIRKRICQRAAPLVTHNVVVSRKLEKEIQLFKKFHSNLNNKMCIISELNLLKMDKFKFFSVAVLIVIV